MADPSDLLVDHTLILLRHAKAVQSADMPDVDRPLAERGHHDAAAAGRWLAMHGLTAGLVLCSTAVRTRETWDHAAAGGAAAADVWFDRRLYNAWPETLLEVVREVPDSARTLLVVGHAPGIPDLARQLSVDDDSPAGERLAADYPTTGLAVLRHGGRWCDLGPGDARLRDFVVPRG